MKLITLCLALLLSGCSLVQFMPSSACEYINYERIGDKVTLKAECDV
jgi:hypothetical protein